ncbi:hypothetical protein COHA_003232 [Chlorella ohadii]|uniref:Arginine biosynthesis bifunctional protein ArgJ, chloroplastic n=1 Tax=Chlorella ohadii TaxID=2649997 RepID=A0AAD5DVA9_9CHLO|nr:hypothetical protein COHA_003232 [Chlorella ohadii]
MLAASSARNSVRLGPQQQRCTARRSRVVAHAGAAAAPSQRPAAAAPAMLPAQPSLLPSLREARGCIPPPAEGERFDVPHASPALHFVPHGPWTEVAGGVCAPMGFSAEGLHAGLCPTSRRADAALLCSDRPAATAGHFSANVLAGASVALSSGRIDHHQQGRAILMHHSAANVGTGHEGAVDAQQVCAAAAAALGVPAEHVLLQSAGSLGQRLPLDRLLPALPVLASQLGASAEQAFHAAVAMTDRDSTTKEAALEVALGGLSSVRLGGMAHASPSGVQAAITCDAAVHPGVRRAMFARAAADSFGLLALCEGACLNDSVLSLANGAARNPPVLEPTGAAAVRLEAALTALMQGLAKAVAWDTSRAGCLFEVAVHGADSTEAARQVRWLLCGMWR